MFFSTSSSSANSAEKEQAAALKAVIQARKATLKQDLKQIEQDSKQELREAKQAFKKQEHEIKLGAFHKMAERVQDEIASIQATDEYKNGDDKTKKSIDQVQSWILWGLGKETKKQEEKLMRYSSTLPETDADSDKDIDTATLAEKSVDQKLNEIC